LPLKTAIAFHFPFTILLPLYHTWHFRRVVEYKILYTILAGALFAMPFGLIFLNILPETSLKMGLGLFLVLYCTSNLFGWRNQINRSLRSKKWTGLVFGLFSGLLHGAYTLGGPGAVVYVTASIKDPKSAKGVLGIYFAIISTIVGIMYAGNDIFSKEWLLKSFYYSPAVVVGFAFGFLAFRRLEAKWYRYGLNLLLMISAISLLVFK
jgi:uncharacterized membrane protein YfcA